MQAKMIVFPTDDGFTVLIWGRWMQGSMRVRRFENRAAMIALLENLQLVTGREADDLEHFDFLEVCPLYSAEVDERTLAAHGFRIA